MHSRIPLMAMASVAVLSLAACGGDADPAGYPESEITLVVPFSAGGPTDTITRLVAEPMAEELGQQIVVQNVEGAGGTVASAQVADEDGDGYNMLVHHIGMSTAPALYPDLEYDPLEDFKTIGLITDAPMTLVARKDFEPETLEELVSLRGGERRHRDHGQRRRRCGLASSAACCSSRRSASTSRRFPTTAPAQP